MIEGAKDGKKAIDALNLDPEAAKRWKELVKSDPFVQEFASGESQEAKLLEETMRPLEEFMKLASSEIDLHAQLKSEIREGR